MDWWLWAGLAVLLLGLFGGLALVVVRGLALWGQLKRTGRTLTDALERLARDADQIAVKAEAAGGGSARLAEALGRLARSRARLSVLLAALKDARAALGRFTAVYPRK